MDVIRKDATITNTDEDFPGSFEVVLSAPTKDRDGDTFLPEEWKTPLPDHITFDVDHGLSVAATVGSGTPRLDAETGNLLVSGTYSSLPRAQEVRTLVREGHINRTSVAVLNGKKTLKDGKTVPERELLNGSFVSVPSNREAVVLASKAAALKAGARNSKSDAEHIQAIHDHATALGATHGDVDVPSDAPETSKNYRDIAFRLFGKDVDASALGQKDADTDDATDPAALISGVDAAIDEALDLFGQVDLETLPAKVQQAIALIQAADATVDELLDALGITDPDEDADSGAVQTTAAGAAKAAPAAAVETAPVEVTDSDVLDRFLQFRLAAFQ